MNTTILIAAIALILLSGCIQQESAWQTTADKAFQKIEQIDPNKEEQVLDASEKPGFVRVDGKVVDAETLEPIENATVTIQYANRRETGTNGQITFQDLQYACTPKEECKIRANAKGYYNYETSTFLQKGINQVTIKLVKE
jgi:PBP1b-binding outer membrane lipoprotein LpoB